MSSIEKAIARQSSVSKSDNTSLLSIRLPTQEAENEQQLITENKSKIDLNFDELARAGFLTPQAMQSALADEYRLLKRVVMLNTNNVVKTDYFEYRNPVYGNFVAITSALKGEGKTFTAFNLAMSIATGWHTTALLVDCGWGENSLTKLLGLTEAPGLRDVLLDSTLELSDVVCQTNISGLTFLPSGRSHTVDTTDSFCPHSTELFSSQRMQELVNELARGGSSTEHMVLFDTSPLLDGSQALMLTSMVGQVLVVAREGKTQLKFITEAVSLLDDTKTIGMVLNGCHQSSTENYN